MDDIIIEFNTARQAIVRQYEKTALKVRKTYEHIQFNKKCLQHNITPKYAQIIIKNNTKAAHVTQKKARTLYIKQNIRELYSKKDRLNITLYKLHLEIANTLGHELTTNMIYQTNKLVDNEIKKVRSTHNKKFYNLSNKVNKPIPEPAHKFHTRTINLTNTNFTEQEMTLINKGLNYNMHYKTGKHTDTKIILDTETAIQNTNLDNQDSLRHDSKNVLIKTAKKKQNTNNEIKVKSDIKQKTIENNITFAKADKGNTTVIINTDTLDNKIMDYIKLNNITELKNNPTDNYQQTIKQTINNSKHVLNNNDKKYLKQIHPMAPTLQALPKIHKPNIPIRPIVNYQNAPAHKLAKYIEKTLRQYININTNTYIKNRTHLIEKIKNIAIPHNSTLASFDITNLYTNIPIAETLNILEAQLTLNNTPKNITTEIISILKIITTQNYFTFHSKYYSQPDGLPMGSPISSILAEIFLQHIEKTLILKNNKYTHKIIYWHRYVDDILVLYNGNNRQCKQFLAYVNKLHPKLHFTAEYEKNRNINFLDLTITKDNNQKHSFNIYRKPTMTDTLIHNTSNHPIQHKLAAFKSMLHRLINTPMTPDNTNKELDTIKYLAHTNGYDPTLINKLWGKIQNVNNSKTHKIDEDKKYITLTYINKTSEKIAHKFRNKGYKVAFKTNNKLKQNFTHRTHTPDKHNRAGVYKLTCTDCNKFYIGQTGRSFTQRYKEHIQAITRNTESTFANHIIETGHTYTNIDHNLEILHTHKKGQYLNTLEQYEIYKHTKTENKDILNEQTQYKSHTLFDINIQSNRQQRHQHHLTGSEES